MLKFWISVSILVCCSSAQAEEVGPWFGSEVASPEQVSVIVTATNGSDPVQNPNCTIYSCPKLKNIVKPELKSAANP
jgi:hypothetical protein